MIKICSLDFLNRDVFDADVKTQDGAVLYSAGTPITPEVILKLYFKDIYVDNGYFDEAIEVEKEVVAVIDTEAEALSSVKTSGGSKGPHSISTPVGKEKVSSGPIPAGIDKFDSASVSAEKEKTNVKLPEEEKVDAGPLPLEFDEVKAKRVAEYATKLARLINMPEAKIKELEQAAYYCNIGRKMFTEADLSDPKFKKKQAEASYNILLHEMDFPEIIAEVAKDYLKKYESSEFKLIKNELFRVPYAHIVAIANYYDDEISSNKSKSAVLEKMLQIGGTKFNIFILHKFINMMRK